MTSPLCLPSPALIDRAFLRPLTIVSSQYGTSVYNAEHCLVMTFPALDLDHEERAKMMVALITARAEGRLSLAYPERAA